MPDATSLSAGFMVVHGNRLDELRSLVVSWMAGRVHVEFKERAEQRSWSTTIN